MVISANKFTYQSPVIIIRGYDSNALWVEMWKFSKKLFTAPGDLWTRHIRFVLDLRD
jgi:hypothetical protein